MSDDYNDLDQVRMYNALLRLPNCNEYLFLHKLNTASESPTSLLKYTGVDFKKNLPLFEKFDRTLRTYITKTLLSRKILPSSLYTLPTTYTGIRYPHRPPLKTVVFAPNEFRVFFSVIINFIDLLHKKKKVLHPFSINNLVIKEEKLLFYNVLTKDQSQDPNAANLERGADFHCVHKIIEMIYSQFTMPDDIKRLSGILRDNKWQSLFPKHLALMTTLDRTNYFQHVFTKYDYLVDNTQFVQTFQTVLSAITNWQGWTDQFDINDSNAFEHCALHQVFNYNKHNFVGRSPQHDVVNKSLLKCCRHMSVHLKDHFPGTFYFAPFCLHDVDMHIMSIFCNQMIDFQEKLAEFNALQYLDF